MSSSEQRKRGAIFSGFLLLVFLGVFAQTYFLFFDQKLLNKPFVENMGTLGLYALGGLNIIFIICIVGTWHWKRWGVFGSIVIYLINFVVEFYAKGFELSYLVFPIFYAIAVGTHWKFFRKIDVT